MGQGSTHLNSQMQQQETSIPLWKYDKERHGWSQKQCSTTDSSNKEWSQFRVVTYNVWFSDKYQPMRVQNLCDILNKSNAQVIALQEMTKNILQHLLAQPFVQERYYISDGDGRTFNGWYGVVLLIDIRLHISRLNLINFPQSNMGRRLVLAEIKLDNNEILRIGTVHLESLNNTPQRLCQLNICQNAFNRSPGTCILMGDFNFHAQGQENIDQFKALPGWIDVWTNIMGIDNRGYTFDTETNSMTKLHNGGADQSRYDRIILRSNTLIPTEIEILGNKSIGIEEDLHIFPSDHFGLTAVFEKRK
ncbi:unnamed protein product [Adineta steineri]|uniref:Endonuclease/exonuclease/phosphatase domain-containing protein n=1 Tax=Adineta steineri TaxID=433720 RepID=A0A818T307_9BILA|nr:unnamed protein product [Adineta steineri]CAF3677993.1 unnamed protein product [Adineta steineri]CAF3736542.1 unnamed protein product [Adineta steineri]